MAIDPTDIYDKGLSSDDLTKKQTEMLSSQPGYLGGQVSAYNPREYTGYLTEGLFEEKGDPDLQRGEAQSAWDKWGNAIPQTVGKIGTQLLDMMGGLQSLVTEWEIIKITRMLGQRWRIVPMDGWTKIFLCIVLLKI